MRRRAARECRRTRASLPLRYYGALGEADARAVERHLSGCLACSAAWESTRRLLGMVRAESAFPREAEVDWPALARRIATRARGAAAARQAGRLAHWPLPLRWAGAAAAAAIVAAVALALLRPAAPGRGEARLVPAGPGDAGTDAAPGGTTPDALRVVQGRLARRRAERDLAAGREVLVNLARPRMACRKSDAAFDIRLEKERSADLLRRMNLYQGTLTGAGDERLAALLAQLEALLMQVASLRDCASARQLHDLHAEIERRRILLRIDLVTREMQGRAPRA